MDSLFFKEHSVKILIFFSTSLTGSQSFSLGIIHWSRSEFGALGLVLIISPSSNLRIAHRFFFINSLFFKKHFVKISKFFSTSSTGWHPVQLVHQVSLYGALILVILEPNSYMAWARGLQISFGLYFGSILGLISDSLQPTMNPYGSLVGKQVESLR